VKPNVLDQSRVGKVSVAGNGAGGGSAAPSEVDMRKLTVSLTHANHIVVMSPIQMAVMEEVHSQMAEISTKQKERVDDLSSEIRKLKAMIVKHESRIRALESRNRELEEAAAERNNNDANATSGVGSNNNGDGHAEDDGQQGELDPDEV